MGPMVSLIKRLHCTRYRILNFICLYSDQTPLRITRNALNAFAVTNRTDIYVLQDVTEGGEETIFYLK